MFLANTVHVKCKTSNYVMFKKSLFGDPSLCGSVLYLSCLTAHQVTVFLILCFSCGISFDAKLQSTVRAVE